MARKRLRNNRYSEMSRVLGSVKQKLFAEQIVERKRQDQGQGFRARIDIVDRGVRNVVEGDAQTCPVVETIAACSCYSYRHD